MNNTLSIADKNINNLSESEMDVAKLILQQFATSGDSKLLEDLFYEDYTEIPVSIDEFICNPRYMGQVYNNGEGVYPFWKKTLHDFFHNNPDKAFELMITGAIGIGKSTVATIALTYLMYRTLCLKDPQKFYGLTGNSQIVFVVMNLTLDLAYEGLYSLIVESIKLSPWFCERVDIRGKYDYKIEFPNNISLMTGSQTTHTIGKNVLGGVLDEVNFSKAPKGSKNSVMDMYRNLRRRLESRFLKAGRIPGLLMMVSSKNTELDFLEQYIQSVKHQKTTWIVDKAVYEIKPPETYTGEKFKVAVGDKTRASRILSDTEDPQLFIDQGYNVIDVPVEYKVAFQQDINDALKDISGISSVSTNKLIPYTGNNKSRPSPFVIEQINLGLDSKEDIRDYLDDLSILRKDLHKPRFAHVDIGLKGDALGLAVVHADKQTMVERYTTSGAIDSVIENSYYVDLLLSVKAIPGSEIPLYKIREFLLWLKSAIGYKLQVVSYDGFQSADSIQLLNVAGQNACLQSLDRTDIPYLNLRSCILERRLDTYHHSILTKELYDLEYDRKLGKVDHPMVTLDGLPGSKDLSDGLCLSHDTKIFLLSGKDMTIEDLYEKGYENEWILACDTEGHRVVPVPIAGVIKKDFIPDSLYKITLDNGESFSVTGNHLILCRDNTYRRADELNIGDSLMPFSTYNALLRKDYYRKVVNPYAPQEKDKFIYRLVIECIKSEEYNNVDLSDGSKFRVIHHINHDKLNDNPDNLEPMSNRAHRKLHGDIFRRYNKSLKHTQDIKNAWKSGRYRNKPYTGDREQARDQIRKYNESDLHREHVSQAWRLGKYDHTIRRGADCILSRPEIQEKIVATKSANGVLRQYRESMIFANKDESMKKSQSLGKIRKMYELVNTHSDLFKQENVTLSDFRNTVRSLKSEGLINTHFTCKYDYELFLEAGVPLTNHQIVNIEIIPNDKPVYDIQLSEIHNFGITAGVFVHNCGALYQAQKHYAEKKNGKALQQANAKNSIAAIQKLNQMRKNKDIDENSWVYQD